MKLIFTCLLQVILSITILFAQQIKHEDLPPGLLYEFQNRYPGVNTSEWKIADNKYIGTFSFMGNEVISYYDITTKWLYSEIKMTLSDIPKNSQKYIALNFAQYKINSIIFNESKGDNNFYKVETFLNNEQYFILFDREGVFLRCTDKDGKIINTETEDAQKGRKEITYKELPTPISSYITMNYSDFTFSKSYFINDAEMENTYYVVLTKSMDKREVELYFDFKGNLSKKVDPFSEDAKNTTEGTNSKSKRKVTEEVSIPETDIPQIIKDDFAKKARNPQKVVWNKTDNTFFVVFVDPAKFQRNVIEYSIEGVWLKTVAEMQPNDLNPNIEKIIKASYPDLKIYSCANMSAPPRERYVYVKLYSPKWANDPMVYHELFFSTSGRLEKSILADFIEGDGKETKQKNDYKDDYFNQMVEADDLTLDGEYKQISAKELPTKVINHVAEIYPTYLIHQCFIMSDDITNELQYWVVIKQEGYRQQKKLIYDFKGKFIEEEEM